MVTCCHGSFGSMATRMFRVENSGLALGPVQRYHQCHVRTDKSRISESDEAKKATLCCMHASVTAWTWLQSHDRTVATYHSVSHKLAAIAMPNHGGIQAEQKLAI